jgi:hypothetical protein
MSNINQMVEVEIKIELTPLLYKNISKIILQNNFNFECIEEQTDYYLQFEKVSEGYNFKRLRIISGKPALITEKKWETIDGEKLRLENEYEINDNEKENLISSDVKYIAKKCRINYSGEFLGYEMHICEDTLYLKNSTKHFIECEIIASIVNAKNAKKVILQWFKDVLEIDNVLIAPSILEMIMADSN